MRSTLLCLLWFVVSWSQTGLDPSIEEPDDPDEQQYVNTLLKNLFDPLDIELADSTQLRSRGFSGPAIGLILHWQQSGITTAGYKRLLKKLSETDSQLLSRSDRGSQLSTQIVLRQKIKYSTPLAGWRILQKGRVRGSWGDLVFLAEQDPGEEHLTDHAVFAISSDKVPGFEKLILGDFHISWGNGLLLNQSGSRTGFTPASLVKQPRHVLRPHYSTREQNYFHGIAGEWQIKGLRGIAFVSSRKARGQIKTGVFKEDSDGIHPQGKSYAEQNINAAGLAGIYEFNDLCVYLALMHESLSGKSIGHELGLYWRISAKQFLQVYVDDPKLKSSRSISSWSYRTGPVQLSIQYRNYPHTQSGNSGSVISMLGAQALNERGFSTRLQFRPRSHLLIRYALDRGAASQLLRLSDSRSVWQHRAQLQYRNTEQKWQLDWNNKTSGPLIPDDIWFENTSSTKLIKLGVSLDQKISSQLQYRLNLKTVSQSLGRSVLIQQRILWSLPNWKGAVGFAKYAIPGYDLRISIYESGLRESFNFFTAYETGQRWFLYLKNNYYGSADLEFRIAQTHTFEIGEPAKQLELSFQLSIVL